MYSLFNNVQNSPPVINSVCTDKNENLFITGYFNTRLYTNDADSSFFPSAENIIAKLDSTGIPIWKVKLLSATVKIDGLILTCGSSIT